jgi:hypothetical protein
MTKIDLRDDLTLAAISLARWRPSSESTAWQSAAPGIPFDSPIV